MVVLMEGIEAEKTAASLAYFQERSEELVAIDAKLLIKRREAD